MCVYTSVLLLSGNVPGRLSCRRRPNFTENENALLRPKIFALDVYLSHPRRASIPSPLRRASGCLTDLGKDAQVWRGVLDSTYYEVMNKYGYIRAPFDATCFRNIGAIYYHAADDSERSARSEVSHFMWANATKHDGSPNSRILPRIHYGIHYVRVLLAASLASRCASLRPMSHEIEM